MKKLFRLPQLSCVVLLLSCTTDVPPDNSVQPTDPTKVAAVSPPVTPLVNTASDVLPPLYPFGKETYFIKGQTSATPSLNVDAFFANKMATPNMGNLIKAGEKLNMVAMGGGMTAGVRNGGLYRAGQMTAYPNLVARQMGITDFQSPLFADNEANGTGYLQLVDDGIAYPSWKEVKNNIATVKAGSPPELPKYMGGMVNNYALPESGGLIIAGRVVNTNSGDFLGNRWSTGGVFASRILPANVDDKSVCLRDQMFKQPINFFIIEDDVDMQLTAIKNNAGALSFYGCGKSNVGPLMLEYTMDLMKEKANADKGVIFTWPIITDLAYFNWYTIEDLKSKANTISISTTRNNESYTLDGSTNNFLFMPTANVDALFRNLKKGDDISITLADTDILDPQEFTCNTNSIRIYNTSIRQLAKERGVALVDLEKIYAQIRANTYVSADGFRVDGSPKGNFFSADGIYPKAIGQAVIANEVIKAINSTYKSSIPLINLKDYSLKVGKE